MHQRNKTVSQSETATRLTIRDARGNLAGRPAGAAAGTVAMFHSVSFLKKLLEVRINRRYVQIVFHTAKHRSRPA
jgi:hypothetical protein